MKMFIFFVSVMLYWSFVVGGVMLRFFMSTCKASEILLFYTATATYINDIKVERAQVSVKRTVAFIFFTLYYSA